MIEVEVAYALPKEQRIIPLRVEEGCTLYQAALRSGIAEEFPEIDLERAPMGIFGKAARDPHSQTLRAGDRVEIYRPLKLDPKAARAQRAARTEKD